MPRRSPPVGQLFSRLENPSALDVESPDESVVSLPRMLPFKSSRVVEAGYDAEHERLFVRFVKPQPYGTPWVYEGVPESVWRNFRRAPSAGKYVNRVLNQYDYHAGDWG